MCGIIGGITKQDVVNKLLTGLKRLEYRGYDSAGIAVINSTHQLRRIRTSGKVQELQKLAHQHSLSGNTGIAHTRWATHGKPSKRNAHPHIAGNEIAIVHNGIIENHETLRTFVVNAGYYLTSETDSELIAHLVYLQLQNNKDFLSAVRAVAKQLAGAYAIGLIRRSEPGRLIALRHNSPLVVGLGDGEVFISSDTFALLPNIHRFIYLEEGDIIDILGEKITIYDVDGNQVNRLIHINKSKADEINKGDFPHFMLKEIFEQPSAVARTLQNRLSTKQVLAEAFGINAPDIFKRVKRIQIVACGTSYHAGLVGKFWLEEISGLPCQVEIASEYRYKTNITEADTLLIALSQSGETADTLAALRLAKNNNYLAVLSICNVPESSIVRESNLVLMIDAGPEIGVASTKSFTCQLTALCMLAIAIKHYKIIDPVTETYLTKLLFSLPTLLEQVLKLNSQIKSTAAYFLDKHNALFLGRGIEFPIALEGALKLKEISYIHAEGFPAGELKHGPLALIDTHMPIVALMPNDDLVGKIKLNLQEVLAREGKLIVFLDEKVDFERKEGMEFIFMPEVNKIIAPIIYVVPLQLLAYHVAVFKGTDIDQPRNLAKSVTVE